MSKSIIKTKIKLIKEYYLFQKKIEYIFKDGFNPLFKPLKKDLFTKITNPFERIYKEDAYIIDIDWIDYWKSYCNYDKAKEYFDKIYTDDEKILEKEIDEMCNNMMLLNEIDSEGITPPPMNNEAYGKIFCNRIMFDLNNLSSIVSDKIFMDFTKLCGQFLVEFRSKTRSIHISISDKIIFLIFYKELKIKIIYFGNKKLIQLTADFAPNEYNILDNRKKSAEIFNKFAFDLEFKRSDYWLDFFEKYKIENTPEVNIHNKEGEFEYLLRNDELFLKSISDIKPKIPNIIFNNVNLGRLIGLTNVGATCYMNATLQCFINTDMLTRYLLTEKNYNNIINNRNVCELTSCYCELLLNVCCNINVKGYYKPKKFKDLISRKNPLFKGINANDSKDLINFMLEEMNNELNLLENKNINFNEFINIYKDGTNKELSLNNFISQFTSKNKSIIPKTFYSINEIQTKCLKCNIIKYNYQVSFLFDFLIGSTYEYCIKNNIPSINNNGDKIVSLLDCFEYFNQTIIFKNDNQIYCDNCKINVDGLYTNYIYSLPPTIIISLNRGKDNVFKCIVDFPETLNLYKYVLNKKSNVNYRLKGVITHLGKSGITGHFIAYCRNRINNNWYCYNDSVVTYCNDQKNDFRKGETYILFYESVDGRNNLLYDNNQNKINNNSLNLFNMNNNFNFNLMNNQINQINNICQMDYNMINNNINNINSLNLDNINMNMNNINNMNNMNSMNLNNTNNINNMNGMSINNMNNMNINNINNMNMNSMNSNNMNVNNMNNINNMNMNNMNINGMNMNNMDKMNSMNNIISMNNMNNMNMNNMNNINSMKMNMNSSNGINNMNNFNNMNMKSLNNMNDMNMNFNNNINNMNDMNMNMNFNNNINNMNDMNMNFNNNINNMNDMNMNMNFNNNINNMN